MFKLKGDRVYAIQALALLVLAGVFGLIALIAILQKKEKFIAVVLLHGGLAAIGLVLVIVSVLNAPAQAPTAAMAVLSVAALGGFLLFGMDMAKRPIPKALVLIHPLMAILGLVLLIVFVVQA